jgi:hypothetical protein
MSSFGHASKPQHRNRIRFCPTAFIHRRMLTFPQCLGPDKADPDWVHDGPCETTDIGFIDKQRHVHFKGHPTDGEICDVVSRLADSGYLQS